MFCPACGASGGRYRIVRRLGSGGFGEVYLADDLTLGQPVALKFLPDGIERDATRLAQLQNEVRMARQVSHPNVCRVYDIGEAEGVCFLSMEYIDGEDLASLLRRIGRLPEERATDLARQLALGVLHPDLKPANVMIDGEGRLRITDFGLAVGGGAATPAMAGTPAYMAPEQLAGQPAADLRDEHAAGTIEPPSRVVTGLPATVDRQDRGVR